MTRKRPKRKKVGRNAKKLPRRSAAVPKPVVNERSETGEVQLDIASTPRVAGVCTWTPDRSLPEMGNGIQDPEGSGHGVWPRAEEEIFSDQPSDDGSRRWRWWSLGIAPNDGSLSVLALAETVVAMAVYAWIAVRWGTLHLMISACIAPLLLLRTNETIAVGRELGVRLLLALGESLKKVKLPERDDTPAYFSLRRIYHYPVFIVAAALTLLATIIMSALVSLMALAIRFWATSSMAVRHPGSALRAMPGNWWNIIACTDIRQPPELLPGFNRDALSLRRSGLPPALIWPFTGLNASALRLTMRRHFGEPSRALWEVARVGRILVAAVLGLPAFVYRLSIKGTALIWMPILWVIRDTFSLPLEQRLMEFRDLWKYRFGRWYSVVVLALFAAKLGLLVATTELGEMCEATLHISLCENVVMPRVVPPWQWALALNSVLGWVLYSIADTSLHRLRHGRSISETFVDRVFRSVWFVRSVLSLYTISCAIYIAASVSGRFDLSLLGDKLFPWT